VNIDTDNGKNNIIITVNYHHNFDKGGFRGDRWLTKNSMCGRVALEEGDFSLGRNARYTSDLNT